MHSIPTFLVIFFFQLDPNELSALFNEKTKAIIFNNPNNPLGKVYQREEIEMIAELCKKHNVLIISDDVYEHMVSISCIIDYFTPLRYLPTHQKVA